jgi:hypothetical protein
MTTDPKETTDLEAAILAVEDEDAAETSEGLDDGAESGAETTDDGKAAEEDPAPTDPEWVAEYKRTGNPHLIPDPAVREAALDQQRRATEKFEKAARIADRLRELETERAAAARPAEEAAPSLGDDIDPNYQSALDRRVEWLLQKKMEALGLDKQVQAVQEKLQQQESQAYGMSVINELQTRHGLTNEDLEWVETVMLPEDQTLVTMLSTPKGRKRFADLVRMERGETVKRTEDIKDKARAGEGATVRPSASSRGSRPVKDYSKMSEADLKAEIAEEMARLGMSK